MQGKAANAQARYQQLQVKEHVKHYIQNRLFPYKEVDHFVMGAFIYDTTSEKARKVLTTVYRDSQIWAIDDQIPLAFAIWYENATVVSMSLHQFCQSILHTHPKNYLRRHATKHYGK